MGNGDITLGDVAGFFILNDGNGDITLRDAIGSFILNVGNGDVTFQGGGSPPAATIYSRRQWVGHSGTDGLTECGTGP